MRGRQADTARPGGRAPDPPGRGPRPRYSRGLLDETIAVWQPYYAQRLTDQDASDIIENVTAFAGVLLGMGKAPIFSETDESCPGSGGHLPLRRQTGS